MIFYQFNLYYLWGFTVEPRGFSGLNQRKLIRLFQLKYLWSDGPKLLNVRLCYFSFRYIKIKTLSYKLSLLPWHRFTQSLTVSCCAVGALLTCHLWERGSCFDSQKTESCQQLWCSTVWAASQTCCHNHQWHDLSVLCLSLPLLPPSVQLHRGVTQLYQVFPVFCPSCGSRRDPVTSHGSPTHFMEAHFFFLSLMKTLLKATLIKMWTGS